MNELPKCKLCGKEPHVIERDGIALCVGDKCEIKGWDFSIGSWQKLMSTEKPTDNPYLDGLNPMQTGWTTVSHVDTSLEQDRRKLWVDMLIEDNKNAQIRSTDRANWALAEFDKRFKQ